MWLRGINFCPVVNASGARGFFGEGYWYHLPWRIAGLTWKNTGFVAKTMTMEARPGNMVLQRDGVTPQDFLPSCIIPKFQSGIVLNSVGLSNPGAPNLLYRKIWDELSDTPFHVSFMCVRETETDRLREVQTFVSLFESVIQRWEGLFGIELNVSCPNTKANTHPTFQETEKTLDILGRLLLPVQVKINALADPRQIAELEKHPMCDAIVMGNTLPWGSMPDKIDWKTLFASEDSPLQRYGGGGLSGPPLRPIHCDWIKSIRSCGFTKPIWGCGGIDSINAVKEYKDAGANGIQLGTVCMMRPWRMRGIIRYANSAFK